MLQGNRNGVVHLPFLLQVCGGSGGGDVKLSHQWPWPSGPAHPVTATVQTTVVSHPWSSCLSPHCPLGVNQSIPEKSVSRQSN